MKIKLVDDDSLEVELIGTVKCISSEFDASWEFPTNEVFNLYEISDSDEPHYIVFNEKSGWYAGYHSINNLSDKDFDFEIIKFKKEPK